MVSIPKAPRGIYSIFIQILNLTITLPPDPVSTIMKVQIPIKDSK